MSRVASFVAVLAIAGCVSAPAPGSAAVTMRFGSHGCTGELSSTDAQETTIVRSDLNGVTEFRVFHAASCGLNIRNPEFTITGESLEMRYEMYSPDGMAIMCDCGYRSTFSFSHLPATVKSASFKWSEHER
jgi:hypothetical protein